MEEPPREVDLDCWESFEQSLLILKRHVGYGEGKTDSPRLLFRGQADSKWELASTLDRSGSQELEIAEHYRVIANRVKPHLQTLLTNTIVDDLPSYEQIKNDMGSQTPDIVSQTIRTPEI